MDEPPDDGRAGRTARYFRNAIERHWDPFAVDLDPDAERIAALDGVGFDALRSILALFGAGEQSVTEDLAPLAAALDEPADQRFVASQLYEEGKHAAFFDRYWREVIAVEESARGLTRTSPNDERWFTDDYRELFERTERAMTRLLTEDTPQNRARAYCHYHLVVEGILAQTGYYAAQSSFGGDAPGLPELPGLVEGFALIRADEGRHVGFGMAKLERLHESGAVDADLLHGTVAPLVALTQNAVSAPGPDDTGGEGPAGDLVEYAAEKHTERMRQILDADATIPEVEELVSLED